MNKSRYIEEIKSSLAKIKQLSESEINSSSKLVDDLGADTEDLQKLLVQLSQELNLDLPDNAEATVADASVGQLAEYFVEIKKS